MDNCDQHFTEANFPYGIASVDSKDGSLPPQCVTRLHDSVIFLAPLAREGHFGDVQHDLTSIFSEPTLNTFAGLGRSVHSAVRKVLQQKVNHDNLSQLPKHTAFPVKDVQMHLPVQIGDFTDFSVSVSHSLRASEVMVGKPSMPPGSAHFPIGYGGRCSSIVVSGTPVTRPMGQLAQGTGDEKRVVMAASAAMDYELELGVIIGKPLPRGKRLMAADADEHVFGFVIVNDWSARDIQALEMAPLGPLNGKNFGTSISPWIISADAVEPFRIPSVPHDKSPAPYLADDERGNYDMSLKVEVIVDGVSTVTCQSQTKDSLYWNFRQMMAHQTIGGCGLLPGDLLATGTVSGSADDARGCLMESTWGGRRPTELKGGGNLEYLKDGMSVRITGTIGEQNGIGFGECIGELKAAVPL